MGRRLGRRLGEETTWYFWHVGKGARTQDIRASRPLQQCKIKLLPVILHVQCCVPLVFARLPKALKKTKKPAASFIGDLHQCQ